MRGYCCCHRVDSAPHMVPTNSSMNSFTVQNRCLYEAMTAYISTMLLSGTQGLKRRASSQALVYNQHLSRSAGAIPVPQALTAAQLISSQELTFTVPTDRQTFARESTTDLGPSGESSTGSRRVSTLDSAPGVLGSAVSEAEQQLLDMSQAGRWVPALYASVRTELNA